MSGAVDPAWWTTGTWEGRPVREALEQRDVSTIFRFLHARGFSYAAIGGLVGLTPARAAEIARNLRGVAAYDVLERVAVGLQIPRAAMGLGQEIANAGDSPAVREPTEQDPGLARLRIELDDVLGTSSVSARQLDLIEEATAHHLRTYPASAPGPMLSRLATDCGDVLRLSRCRQPAGVQARLSGVAALLATLSADALMRLGSVDDARLWYRTAMMAADDSGQARLRILVRAQAAMLPYYYGTPSETVSLAESALALADSACPSSALAAAGRARALARLGATDAAREAVQQALRFSDEVGETGAEEAFAFPRKRLLLYLSGAYTWLGDTAEAYHVQDEALRLYAAGPPVPIDPALIRLDRSMCLAHDHRVAEAATTAQETLISLPEQHRTEILLVRAQDVVEAAPPGSRDRDVAALAECVEAWRGQTKAALNA